MAAAFGDNQDPRFRRYHHHSGLGWFTAAQVVLNAATWRFAQGTSLCASHAKKVGAVEKDHLREENVPEPGEDFTKNRIHSMLSDLR